MLVSYPVLKTNFNLSQGYLQNFFLRTFKNNRPVSDGQKKHNRGATINIITDSHINLKQNSSRHNHIMFYSLKLVLLVCSRLRLIALFIPQYWTEASLKMFKQKKKKNENFIKRNQYKSWGIEITCVQDEYTFYNLTFKTNRTKMRHP